MCQKEFKVLYLFCWSHARMFNISLGEKECILIIIFLDTSSEFCFVLFENRTKPRKQAVAKQKKLFGIFFLQNLLPVLLLHSSQILG
jgi:hypothetical protein